MKSYEKLKAKIDILEKLISDIDAYLSDLMQKPENVISVDGPSVRYAVACIARQIDHDIYQAKRQIWNLK